MALEDLTGPDKFISALVETNPEYQDDRRQGDDHIRGVKNVLLNTFPTLNEAISATPGRLNGAVNNGEQVAFTAMTLGTGLPVGQVPWPYLYTEVDGSGRSLIVRTHDGTNANYCQFRADGKFQANWIQATSDARLKSNIERIEPSEARAILDRLSAYRYTLHGQESIGLLAQEVAEVAPEAVGMSDEKYLTLDYNAIVALLVAARG